MEIYEVRFSTSVLRRHEPLLNHGKRRFLILNEITYPLLRQHLRYQHYLMSPSTPCPSDLTLTFPRLVLLGHGNETEQEYQTFRDHPSFITLYRPISLPLLLRVCLPFDRWFQTRRISFFGAVYVPREKDEAPLRLLLELVRDIIGLTLKRGAYVSRPAWLCDMEMWLPARDGEEYQLTVEDGASPCVGETFEMVLEHMRVLLRGIQPTEHLSSKGHEV